MKVYLSYAARDKDMARTLASELSEAGHHVWFPDGALSHGDNWAKATGEALEQSKAMVVLLSPEAMASGTVPWDISYALGARNYAHRLLPVIVRPTKHIPWFLRTLRTIEVNKDQDQAVRQVVSTLADFDKGSRR